MKTNFHQNLRLLRREKGFTQQSLADYCGCSRAVIGAYEEGRAEPPLKLLIKIARALKVTIDKLVK